LALVKGPPAERRAHLDRFVTARWPSRAGLRQRYGQALAQRNALLARLAAGEGELARFMVLVGIAGVQVNMILALLNLMPIPPLDGGRIVTSLLPPRLADAYSRIEPYGLVILVGLLVTGVLGRILFPLIAWSSRAVLSLTGF